MKTINTIKNINTNAAINHPINAITAEANKPAKLILDDNQEQEKLIL